MKESNEITPAYAFHPGEMLSDELEARAISQADFAKTIGYNRSQINEIINGKRGINAELALLLEASLEIDANFWLNAHKNYELNKAKIEAKNQSRIDAITDWKEIEPLIDIKFLKKRKCLVNDPVQDLDMVSCIFKLNNIADFNAKYSLARYRKSSKLDVNPINLFTWSSYCKYVSAKKKVSSFDPDLKDDLLFNLRDVINENKNLREETQLMLAEYGIKLLFQEKAEKTPVDGLSFWSEENPAICMTLRHKRIDNFAFTLFHELGHVYQHLIEDKDREFVDLEKKPLNLKDKEAKEEEEADAFAKENLISAPDWDYFTERNMSFPDDIIFEFSNKNRIHPAIVRGRLNYELNLYKSKTSIDFKIN